MEDDANKKPKPPWWPECPYPDDVFTMTASEFAAIVPDEHTRTRIAGMLARIGWNAASDQIYTNWKSRI